MNRLTDLLGTDMFGAGQLGDAAGYMRSSRLFRLMKRDIISEIAIKLNEAWKFNLINAIDLKTDGYFHRLGLQYRIRPGWKLNLDLEMFDGSENSYQGLKKDNDRAIVSLTYNF